MAEELEATILKAFLTRAEYCIQLSSVAVLYYDYLLTLPAEIEFFWKNPWKLVTIVYACCRYALVANLLHLLLKTKGIVLSCNTINVVTSVFSVFGHAGIIVVWGLRTYAICDRNKIVAIVVGLLGLTVMVMRIIMAGFSVAHAVTVTAGVACANNPNIRKVDLRMASLGTMMAFEGVSFVLAAFRAWKTLKADATFWEHPHSTLNGVILSQGLLYIAAVFSLSILTAALNLKVWGGIARPMNSLKLPLEGLLTARFLLKIKLWGRRETMKTTTLEPVSELDFTSTPEGRTPHDSQHHHRGKDLEMNGETGEADIGIEWIRTVVDGSEFDYYDVLDPKDEFGEKIREDGEGLVEALGRDLGPIRTQTQEKKWKTSEAEPGEIRTRVNRSPDVEVGEV